MSQVSDPSDLSYPDKPDANGYAKKYFKRRAFYFGAHNSPESFLLFGEWKRRLVESGKPPEVKQVRKELAHQGISAPHRPRQTIDGQRQVQYAVYASVAAALLLAWAMMDRYFFSSSNGPTVDGITLTNEEIDFIRGIRQHRNHQSTNVTTKASEIASLADKLLKEGYEDAASYMEDASGTNQ